MDNFFLSALVDEVEPLLRGRTAARMTAVDGALMIDLQLSNWRQLFISLDRASPAFYLTTRGAEASEGQRPSAFLLLLRKYAGRARLESIHKEPSDRVIHLNFEKFDASGELVRTSLVLALTGRSANAYILDSEGRMLGSMYDSPSVNLKRSSERTFSTLPEALLEGIIDSTTKDELLDRFFASASFFSPQLKREFQARCRRDTAAGSFRSLVHDLFNSRDPLVYSRLPLDRVGQELSDPKSDLLLSHIELESACDMQRYEFASLSEAADHYFSARAEAMALRSRYSSLKQRIVREIAKREAALTAMDSDSDRFGDPEELKKKGDLLLANLATARVADNVATLLDYYDPDQREISFEIPEGATLSEAASSYFERYQKARRALEAIRNRRELLENELDPLKRSLARVEREPTALVVDDLGKMFKQTPASADRKAKREKGALAVGRMFRSTDGYEILVGRNDRENDLLGFRIARPNDLWLHAADYPGSHVIIRVPPRTSPSHRAIIEAAELAAFYSQAKNEGKAAVHYTQKKFVSKPPRSKPGLARLSSFKTIIVEPRCKLERVR